MCGCREILNSHDYAAINPPVPQEEYKAQLAEMNQLIAYKAEAMLIRFEVINNGVHQRLYEYAPANIELTVSILMHELHRY